MDSVTINVVPVIIDTDRHVWYNIFGCYAVQSMHQSTNDNDTADCPDFRVLYPKFTDKAACFVIYNSSNLQWAGCDF